MEKDATKMAQLTRYGIPTMLLIGLGFVVYVALSASSTITTTSSLKSFAVGELRSMEFKAEPPPISTGRFVNADGVEMGYDDIDTKVLVVNFWATTCPPCVYEMPTLGELQSRYDPRDIKVLPMTFDRVGDYPKAKAQLAELTNGQLDFYGDPKMKTLFDAAARGFPTTVVYDASLTEIARYEGDTDWSSPEAFAFFDEVLRLQSNEP